MTRKRESDLAFLAEFLSSPERPEGTLSFLELRGFLFAIVCAPELIMPSDWLPVVFDGAEPEYESMDQAQRFMNALMWLFNETNEKVLTGSAGLPVECKFRSDLMANFEPDAPVSRWSRGFMQGHDWLTDLWDKHVPEDPEGDVLGFLVTNLAFFESRKFAEAMVAGAESGERTFEEYAALFRDRFEENMQLYAELGRRLGPVYRQGLRLERSTPGRNEPCPCGSGLKYKKCCGKPS